MPAATLDLVAPAFAWEPPRTVTDGPLVAELCDMVGFRPDPEQRLILDAVFADPPPRDVGIVAPRQNLKTATLQMMALGWLFVTEERLIVWSAHEFNTAAEAFRDMENLIMGHPETRAQVKHVHRSSGAEAIELTDGRRLRFKARTKGGGRGLTGNRIVLDEAMYLRADHLGALVPTLRAVRDPQLVYAGSAGLLESAEWRRVRDRGRAGQDPSLAYFEWCDPDAWSCGDGCTHEPGAPGCALDDEDRWSCNTALGRRISLDTLRADRRTLPPGEFARETLGWWDDPRAESDDALGDWAACADRSATSGSTVCLGVDVAPNMAAGCIAAASLDPQGRVVVEVVEHGRGTAWIPARLEELRGKHQPAAVGLVAGSPAAALAPDLGDVRELKAGETTAACATFARGVADRQVVHLADERLDAAVRGARRQFAGDGWRWSRRESDADISPLYAATVARHLLLTAPEQPLTAEELLNTFG